MMPSAKQARRNLRHEIQAKARRDANRRIGLYSTPGQVNAAGRILTDRFFAAMKRATRAADVQLLES
jgi:hypothetical protein